MFHKVKKVAGLLDYLFGVRFLEDVIKIHDVKPLFSKCKTVDHFLRKPELFFEVLVATGSYEVVWIDDLDLFCDELFEKRAADGDSV